MSKTLKTSTALKRTKAELWDGNGYPPSNGNEYICIAALEAGAATAYIVQPLISKLIAPYISFEGWLSARLGLPTRAFRQEPAKLQATRRAWLDHLIAEYQAKGD